MVFIGIAAVLFLPHTGQPRGIPVSSLTISPTMPAASITQPASAMPSLPPCTISITGLKVLPSAIRLQVMTSTCYSGDISELSVSINGEKKGTLGTDPGATGTYPGSSSANMVVVVAKFSNGAENVVYQNSAL